MRHWRLEQNGLHRPPANVALKLPKRPGFLPRDKFNVDRFAPRLLRWNAYTPQRRGWPPWTGRNAGDRFLATQSSRPRSAPGRVMPVGILIGAPGSRHQDQSGRTADIRRNHVTARSCRTRSCEKAVVLRTPPRPLVGQPRAWRTSATANQRTLSEFHLRARCCKGQIAGYSGRTQASKLASPGEAVSTARLMGLRVKKLSRWTSGTSCRARFRIHSAAAPSATRAAAGSLLRSAR